MSHFGTKMVVKIRNSMVLGVDNGSKMVVNGSKW